ncbi:MAG: cadmium-translocating P-type ATPase [Ruminococcaceae bacterium]|nr:cadmium-translocating P-type ATPase [Oscillospiraceae bacterium]
MKKVKFDISGMSCSACSAHIENKVNSLDNVSCTVNLLQNSMVAEFDENTADENIIIDAVKSVGYGAKIHDDTIAKDKKALDTKFIKLIISIILLIPLMVVGMGHMFSLHIEPTISVIIQIILTAIIVVLNFKYFTSGFKGLFKLSPNMDSLIALGATASVVYSFFAIFTTDNYIHHLYFESAAMILTFVSIGKYFESRSKAKTSQAISKLIELSPEMTLVVRDDKEMLISTDEVEVGDVVIIKSGDRISVDGKVIYGSGFADESALTGESMHIEKIISDDVFCGTMLSNGYIKVKAEKVKGDTTLSKIIALVEDAASSKAPIAKIADTVSKFFVPTIIALAIITTFIWNLTQNEFSTALSFGIAVLVISCPCALGLATPTAIMVATGVAASNSILIKSSQALEILSKAKNIVFDKTGTITEGTPHVSDVKLFSNIKKDELLKIASSIEKLSSHPLSSAIIEEYKASDYYEVENFENITSKGIKGTINGVTYKIGNSSFANPSNISDDSKKGFTKLYVSDDSDTLGIIYVSDKIKESSKFAIESLNQLGINTYMLTGDNADSANYVKERTGVSNVFSALMPDDKERIVKDLKNSGVTIMVGDGINDSPALVSADVGIAIGAGTDIAIDSADVILTRSDLSDVLTAVELSKATLKNIKENLFWAFIYNVIFIPIAAGALYPALHIRMEPMYGTIAMSLSSICVVTNALRLKLFKPKKVIKENINMKTMIIDGMMCMHCKAHVEKALNAIDGVSATVDLESKSASVTGDVSNEVLKKAVIDAGYTVISIE